MEPTRIILLFLVNLITLGSAEYEDSNVPSKATEPAFEVATPKDATARPLFSKFEWTHLVGDPPNLEKDLDEDDHDDAQPRAVYWIPTTCDSFTERGYTCLACGESLHCMAANFGLKAICGGRRPFCHNGVCSYTRGQKCATGQDLSLLPASADSTDEGFTNSSLPLDTTLHDDSAAVPLLDEESAAVPVLDGENVAGPSLDEENVVGPLPDEETVAVPPLHKESASEAAVRGF